MNMNMIRLTLLVAVCLSAAPAQAQKVKKPALPPGDLFFTMKGQPFALERLAPGIVGALLLTDEQKLELTGALEQTIWSDDVRTAGRTLKGESNLTDVQKVEARNVVLQAQKRLRKLVAAVLSDKQKSLIIRIDEATADAHIDARKSLEGEFSAAKGDKFRTEELNRQLREEVRAEMDRSLRDILTTEQRQSMEKAAQQQTEADQAAAKRVK